MKTPLDVSIEDAARHALATDDFDAALDLAFQAERLKQPQETAIETEAPEVDSGLKLKPPLDL